MDSTTERRFEVNHLAQLARQETATIQSWIDNRYVTSLNGRKPGRGTRRQFTRASAFAMFVGGALKRASIGNDTIRKATQFLERADLQEHFSRGEKYLVANNQQLFIARRNAVFGNNTGKAAAVVVLDLGKAVDEFERIVAM